MQLIKITSSGHRLYCDGRQHISMKGDKEVCRWECACFKEKVVIDNENVGASDMYGRGSGNFTGD